MKLLKAVFAKPISFNGGTNSVTNGKTTSPDRPGSLPAEVVPYELFGIPGVLCTQDKSGVITKVFVPFTNLTCIEVTDDASIELKKDVKDVKDVKEAKK